MNELAKTRDALVSVILPVFNAEKYIGEAIESILAQTYTELELIIVNDGSTDRSLEIISEFLDPRISVENLKQNGGLVKALNHGVSCANGAYIARMDADDIAEPNRIAAQMQFLHAQQLDVCGSAIALFGKGIDRVVHFPISHNDIEFRLLYSSPMAHPTVLGRTVCFHKVPYRADFPVSEDYDMWSRMFAAGYRFGNISEPLLRYRVHANQVSVRKRQQQLHEGFEIAKSFAFSRSKTPKLAEQLTTIQFGFCETISLHSFSRVSTAIEIMRADGDVSVEAAKEMLLYLGRKIQPMNLRVALVVLNALRAVSASLSYKDFLYILFQGVFCVENHSRIYKILSSIKR